MKPPRCHTKTVFGFSLVEVTLAVGLVSYALIALLGLFALALSSSRESSLETALSQIVLHATSTYDGTSSNRSYYSYNGIAVPDSSPEKYFELAMTSQPSNGTNIPNTSNKLHLLTFTISSPGTTNVVQSSVFIP